MIRFDLRCRRDHHFEGWFRDNAAYEAQAAAGDLNCPVCGSVKVEKAIMAPRLAKGTDGRKSQPGGVPMAKGGSSEDAKALRAALEKLRDHVESTCDDVGEAFPEEARKIHYGEAEARGIYGQASEPEAEALAEEGIDFSRLPLPRNDS
ncbi:MAG: DUF1178 family protein [Kiloniellales bacterium]|nr:DUF1178 family protein [Kiloniellales bacterium]